MTKPTPGLADAAKALLEQIGEHDLAHADFEVAELRAALAAAQQQGKPAHEAGQAGGGEPVAWAVYFSEDGPPQLWARVPPESPAFVRVVPLYTHPTPRADASRGCTVAFCERHRAVEVVAGPFCPACSLGDTLRDGIKAGRETEAAFPTRQHKGCDHPRADAATGAEWCDGRNCTHERLTAWNCAKHGVPAPNPDAAHDAEADKRRIADLEWCLAQARSRMARLEGDAEAALAFYADPASWVAPVIGKDENGSDRRGLTPAELDDGDRARAAIRSLPLPPGAGGRVEDVARLAAEFMLDAYESGEQMCGETVSRAVAAAQQQGKPAHEAGQAGGGLHLQDGMPAGICVSAFAASGGSSPTPAPEQPR